MPFLNLRKLLHPRKMWKVFTNKLQNKLHKLNRSKAIKKPKIKSYKTTRRLDWQSPSIQPKKSKIKPKTRNLIHLQKRTPRVHVDQVFAEPVSRVHEGRLPPPLLALEEEETDKDQIPNLSGHSNSPEARNESSTVMSDQESSAVADDDMWESMVLTSPQTQGIDQRADEFIARFRAQMRRQEMMARRL